MYCEQVQHCISLSLGSCPEHPRALSFLSRAERETREKRQKELFYLILLLHTAVQSWLSPGGFSA